MKKLERVDFVCVNLPSWIDFRNWLWICYLEL